MIAENAESSNFVSWALKPKRENFALLKRADCAVPNDMDFANLRYLAKKNVRPDPACATCSRCERLALLDDVANEEMLGHDEEIYDRKGFQIVVRQPEVRIVARCQKSIRGIAPCCAI